MASPAQRIAARLRERLPEGWRVDVERYPGCRVVEVWRLGPDGELAREVGRVVVPDRGVEPAATVVTEPWRRRDWVRTPGWIVPAVDDLAAALLGEAG